MIRAHLARLSLACAIIVSGLATGLIPNAPDPLDIGPSDALALDQNVSTCDWATFSTALSSVQTDGGGTITFSCTGTIVFAQEVSITTPVTIVGNGDVIFSGNGSTRLFYLQSGSSLELENLTLSNASGGAGAAIYSFNSALTIRDTSFSNNTSTVAGGAIYATDLATTVISTSTFVGNSAPHGGAIFGDVSGSLSVSASTFNNNSTTTGDGGAIAIVGVTGSITASTIAGNSAGGNGGGVYIGAGSASTIQSSIVASNSDLNGRNCARFGTLTSLGSNLGSDPTCGFTATGDIQSSSNINLGSLADNGGPTRTMLPLTGSDALDNADCALSTAVDQRGEARPTSGCDIGAVEVVVPAGPSFSIDSVNADSIAEGASATLNVTVSNPDSAALNFAFDCDNDTTYETTGISTGTLAGSGQCSFDDDGIFTVGISVCDKGDPSACDTDSATVTVTNLAPVIQDVTTDGPVQKGQPVTVTVMATDQGVDDILSYRFDCNNDGTYEVGPQVSNAATCPTDPSAATTTINVEVSDGDSGIDTDSVEVSQAMTLCASYSTGAISTPRAGTCPSGTIELNLPAKSAMTFCVNIYTGAITWSANGKCQGASRAYVMPGSGPINYCQSLWTGKIRYSHDGQCRSSERAGVIPG